MTDGQVPGPEGQAALAPAGPAMLPPVEFEDPYSFLCSTPTRKAVTIVLAVLIALCSFFIAAPWAASPETHSATISSLDQKRESVLALIAGATAASAAVTAIPDDVGTPIAEKLVDIGGDFLIVLTAIYLEKYLLTVLGWAAFGILVPMACLFIIGAVLMSNPAFRKVSVKLSAKMLVFGLALILTIPASVAVSGMIESTYSESVEEITAMAEKAVADAEAVEAENAEADSGESSGDKSEADGAASIIDKILTPVSDKVAALTEEAQQTLNGFIEAFAVMIVTSCIIPILVLVFFLWLAKVLLGVNIDVPMQMLKPGGAARLIPRPRG